MNKGREWGDFQTPQKLARQICSYLLENGVQPEIVIEPTFGLGNFVTAALETFPTLKQVYGVEINQEYVKETQQRLVLNNFSNDKTFLNINLHNDNIFKHKFSNNILHADNFLIVGNPPWVTNSELGSLVSENLPQKSNLKALKGLEARTGKSNFDISEYILLELLELFSGKSGTLAMLCKTSVIKNLVEGLPKQNSNISNIKALKIDALSEFDAAVDASLFVATLGVKSQNFTCSIASLEKPAQVSNVFGWVGQTFVADLQLYQQVTNLHGKFPLEWRQGLKHDCAKIMELQEVGQTLINLI